MKVRGPFENARWAPSPTLSASRRTQSPSSALVLQDWRRRSRVRLPRTSCTISLTDQIRYLLAERAFSRIQIFEQRSTVGGIWNYVPYSPSSSTPKDLATPQISPNAGHDEPVLDHSGANKVLVEQERKEAAFMTPMYDRLETNIPRMLMGFSDLDWPEDCQLFPRHEEVMEYIKRYSEDVRHLISFGTQVLDVRLDTNKRWLVKTQEVAQDGRGKIDEQTFDAVVVSVRPLQCPIHTLSAWHGSLEQGLSLQHLAQQMLPQA